MANSRNDDIRVWLAQLDEAEAIKAYVGKITGKDPHSLIVSDDDGKGAVYDATSQIATFTWLNHPEEA